MMTFSEFTSCSGEEGVDSERFTVGTCMASAPKIVTALNRIKNIALILFSFIKPLVYQIVSFFSQTLHKIVL